MISLCVSACFVHLSTIVLLFSRRLLVVCVTFRCVSASCIGLSACNMRD